MFESDILRFLVLEGFTYLKKVSTSHKMTVILSTSSSASIKLDK